MAEEKKKEGWSTTTKVVVAIVVILIIILLVWAFFFRNSAKGNQYASAGTIQKVKSGNYTAWKDSFNEDAITKLQQLIPGTYWQNISNGDAYGRAWLKGMNLEPTLKNVNEFAEDITQYGKASFKKPHWEITTGSFVNATS
ncbi:MAG: hypothetical protein KIS94_05600 [Chitinophagales bacterium]|nr:hypothetical protein [Chitinophagales bacterium]